MLASILRAFTGFGFALAAMPILSMFLTPTDAVVVSAALTLALGTISLRTYRTAINSEELFPLVAMALLGTFVGASLLVTLSVAVFQLCVGLSVILACLGIGLARGSPIPRHPLVLWGTGLLSGIMNGAMGIPGPPIIVYVLATEREPARNRALMMSFFTISAMLALVFYGSHGMINSPAITYILLALPALYAGDSLGARLFLKYGDTHYRRVALVSLAGLGITTILQGIL